MSISFFVEKWLEERKKLHDFILGYLENDESDEINFQSFISNIEPFYIQENKTELAIFLHLVSYISKNHYQLHNFFKKIELILNYFHETISRHFSNFEVFNIFKKNKRILLFLFKEKIITPDINIAIIISKGKFKKRNYIEYFLPEFKSFFNQIQFTYELNEFDQKRQIGENDSYICNLIRNDLIVDFVKYSNQTNLNLSSQIEESIFETHSFLIDKKPSLIEYSAFFGSIQIFKFLQINNVKTTSSLWLYAIHGQNHDIIHNLEENKVPIPDQNYYKLYKESIKCHHIDIMNYFKNNFYQNEDIRQKQKLFTKSLHFFNFNDLFNNDLYSSFEMSQHFYNFCKYDYIPIVDYILKDTELNLDINMQIKYVKHRQIFTKTPLFFASEKGNSSIVSLLLSQEKIDVNKKLPFISSETEQLSENKSAFHVAIEKGNPTIIQLFLDKKDKLDINAKKTIVFNENDYFIITNSKSVLELAVESGNPEIVQLLLSQDKLNKKERSTLQVEFNKNDRIIGLSDFYSGNDEMITETICQKTALYAAVESGNCEIVRLLLSDDINELSTNVNFEFSDSLKYIENQSGVEHKKIDVCINNKGIAKNNILFCFKNSGMLNGPCFFCLYNSGAMKNCFYCLHNTGSVQKCYKCNYNKGLIHCFICDNNKGVSKLKVPNDTEMISN